MKIALQKVRPAVLQHFFRISTYLCMSLPLKKYYALLDEIFALLFKQFNHLNCFVSRL